MTETRTFYLISGTGEFVFLQLAYTCSGWPIAPTSQVTGRYFDPRQAKKTLEGRWVTCEALRQSLGGHNIRKGQNSHVFECRNRPGSKVKLSPDRSGISIDYAAVYLVGPSLTASQKIHPTERHQNANMGIRGLYEGAILGIDFIFNPFCSGVQFGDGKISFGLDGGDGSINMAFFPLGSASGRIVVDEVERDFTGHGIMLHQYQGIRPNLVANHWHLALFISDPDKAGHISSLLMLEICTPATYGSATVRYGIVYTEGRLLALCSEGQVIHSLPILDRVSGYYIPSEVIINWSGVTIDGEPFTAECQVRPRTLCDRMNLLDQLPFIMRKMVETFVTKPYVYQWIDRTDLSLTVKGKTIKMTGSVVTELSILGED